MFPPRLAAETLSLRLNEPRCAVSVSAVIDADGDVREYWIGPSTVTVTHAMSDADVDAALREDEENAGKTGAKTHPALALLVEAAARRRRRRERDGAINVATPECIVKVRTREEGSDSDSDSDGRGKNGGAPLGFLSEDEDDLDGDLDGGEKGGNAGERAANAVRAIESDAMRVELSRQDADSRSRLLVSEMMILAGDLAGALGAEEGVPLPYRRQAPPRDDARDRDVVDALPPGLPREFAIRATMRGATQSSSPGPHASLGVDAYVQFTSPIRRHTDLLAQYQLKAHLRGERKLPLDKARIPHTGPHATPFARCTPILEDFLSRRVSPPITPRFRSRHAATPFNSTPDAFRLHPDVRSYGPSTLSSRWTRC